MDENLLCVNSYCNLQCIMLSLLGGRPENGLGENYTGEGRTL